MNTNELVELNFSVTSSVSFNIYGTGVLHVSISPGQYLLVSSLSIESTVEPPGIKVVLYSASILCQVPSKLHMFGTPGYQSRLFPGNESTVCYVP